MQNTKIFQTIGFIFNPTNDLQDFDFTQKKVNWNKIIDETPETPFTELN